MNAYVLGCPECSMSFGMHSPIQENGEHLQCSANPGHRFRKGEDGFLKSI
jgi:hypothetical protein